MTERIDAPQRVLDAIKRAQETIDRLQAEAQAVLFGAAAGLAVPDDWQWDGRGWAAPMPAEPAAYAPTPDDWQWDGRGWAAPMPAEPAAYAPTPEDAPA